MNDRDWLLAVLSDGKPHSHAELLRRSDAERGHGLTVHSRAADLRKLGHDVRVTTWRANGRTHSSYQLVQRDFEYPAQRVEATKTPEGAKGWVDRTGSAQVPASGHGFDVTPDASPDGVRAETRRENDRVGSEPSNAPAAATLFEIPASVRGAYGEAA